MAELTRGQMQDLVRSLVILEPRCRKRLMADPKQFVEMLFGCRVPEHVDLRAIEEPANTVYVLVPYRPGEGEELDDERLEKVAGGLADKIARGRSEDGAINVRQIFNLD